MKFCYKDGEFIGSYHKDDPIWNDSRYTDYIKTDARIKQMADRLKKAAIANTGTTVYNNGTIAIKLKDDDIPSGFVVGGLPRPCRKKTGMKVILDKDIIIDALTNKTKAEVASFLNISIPTLDKMIKHHNIEI